MDHSARAQSRIHWQYRGAAKLREWIDTLPAIAQSEVEDPAQTVVDILDIDNRSGAQLDIIGRIVGLGRRPVGEADGQATDALFRLLIKARIEVNNGDATVNDIVEAVENVTGASQFEVVDNQDMSFSLTFAEPITDTTRFALLNYDIIPRPQTVGFVGLIAPTGVTPFGVSGVDEDDNPAALGFSEIATEEFILSDGTALELSDGTNLRVTNLNNYALSYEGGALSEVYEVQ